MRFERVALVILVVWGLGSAWSCAGETGPEADAGGAGVVAVWDGGEVGAEELDSRAGAELLGARQQLYDAQVSVARDLAVERVIDQRAEAAGEDRDAYRERLVSEAVEPPTDEQVAQLVQQHRSRLPEDDEQARARVVEVLQRRAREAAEQDVERQLLDEAGFRVLIDPPRADVAVSDQDMTRGPADAPVRIVEFTDYQCPYCGRAQETLKQVKDTYGDQVRFVFKDLPLKMHPSARMAAEAARCAGDQGAFWELHDWLFDHAAEISRESVLQAAADLGLDADALAACLDEGRHTEAVDASIEQAERLGVSSTPSFFVNGRLVRGAQPFEVFAEIIDDELARAGVAE